MLVNVTGLQVSPRLLGFRNLIQELVAGELRWRSMKDLSSHRSQMLFRSIADPAPGSLCTPWQTQVTDRHTLSSVFEGQKSRQGRILKPQLWTHIACYLWHSMAGANVALHHCVLLVERVPRPTDSG